MTTRRDDSPFFVAPKKMGDIPVAELMWFMSQLGDAEFRPAPERSRRRARDELEQVGKDVDGGQRLSRANRRGEVQRDSARGDEQPMR